MKLLMLRIGRSPFRVSYTSSDVREVALAVGLGRACEEKVLTRKATPGEDDTVRGIPETVRDRFKNKATS